MSFPQLTQNDNFEYQRESKHILVEEIGGGVGGGGKGI